MPRLASANGGAGLPHATWRPQMQTFLMRQGIEECDYAHEIPQWRELVQAVGEDATSRRLTAIATLLGATSSNSSNSSKQSDKSSQQQPTMKRESLTPEQQAAKKEVSELISRARKAFGYLYAALPTDLRQLVADIPQGYAYGIWSFLEKKFRNTEQDTVMALWERFTTLRQDTEEAFDEYKARVDSVVELLTHAKQTPPAELYATLLLWRLQPRYATAVLTLKTGDRLKDAATIDWTSIAKYMGEYERSQQSLSESEVTADRTMAARQSASSASGSKSQRSLADIECFNCHKKGHYASKCPLPDRRMNHDGKFTQKQYRKGSRQRRYTRSASGSSEDEHTNSASSGEGYSQRADMVRGENRFTSLSTENTMKEERSYCARVLAGIAAQQATVSNPAPRRRLIRPGEPSQNETRSNRQSSNANTGASSTLAAPSSRNDQSSTKQSKTLDAALRTTAKAIDTAASVSTTMNRNTLVSVRRCAPVPIKMADGTIVTAMYKGELPLRLKVAGDIDGRCARVTIPDVYYHERFDANLLSWSRMRKDGWQFHSTKSSTYVVTPGGKRIDTSTRGGLTLLEDAGAERVYGARLGNVIVRTAEDMISLHQRLGHVSWSRLVKMCQRQVTVGIGDIKSMSDIELEKAKKAILECSACAKGKAHRNATGHRGLERGTQVGEVLHMDTFYAVTRDPRTEEKRS
jgi:hypothetical protein